MDRRAALKRLAAGGAIAAGGSFVLSSNAVALTTSGPIIGIPGPGQNLPIDAIPNNNGTITISDGTNATCGTGSPAVTAYMWRIQAHNLGSGNNQFFILIGPAANGVVLQAGPEKTPVFTGPPLVWVTGTDTVTLRKDTNGGQLKPLDDGDSYSIGLMVSWTCGSTTTTLTYTLAATVPTLPLAVPA